MKQNNNSKNSAGIGKVTFKAAEFKISRVKAGCGLGG